MRIVIIGAGPAGAMAAVRLARAGAAVTLLDPSHPREKPCGGGLTGRALALVSDCIDIAALPAVVVRSARVEPPAKSESQATVRLVDRGLSSASSLVVMRRAIFDKALVDAAIDAGARLIPKRVVDVTRRGSTMLVHTTAGEHVCDFVLGGDGAGSLVRKKLSRPFSRREMSIAAGFFAYGSTASEIVVKCIAEQSGYLWSFPRPDHLAVGICSPASESVTSSDLRAQSLAWINDRLGWNRRADANRVLQPYAWPIPSIGLTSARHLNTSAGPGWMLLGDAAGLVDPLTREGIYYALLSGQWAAEALAHSFARADGVYASRLIAEIHPELQRAARLNEMFFSTAFSTLFVMALRQSAPIREVFADLVAGTQLYKGLRRRLLATGEWKLAGRAARCVVAGFQHPLHAARLRPSTLLGTPRASVEGRGPIGYPSAAAALGIPPAPRPPSLRFGEAHCLVAGAPHPAPRRSLAGPHRAPQRGCRVGDPACPAPLAAHSRFDPQKS